MDEQCAKQKPQLEGGGDFCAEHKILLSQYFYYFYGFPFNEILFCLYVSGVDDKTVPNFHLSSAGNCFAEDI